MPEYRKKLIEVALPLAAINKESAREKSIRHGHPSTLHIWWSRKPLATARAVLFAQLVDDPSSCPDEFPTEEAQEIERQRLFRIIEELVKWENGNNEEVLHAARTEVARSAARNQGMNIPRSLSSTEVSDALHRYAPKMWDPFCGGGSIPLEAQRLGLEANASDLNPVAVLLTKSLIELPPKFAGQPPVNPDARKTILYGEWRGIRGLADDVRYYGKWMRTEAEKLIGYLYPRVRLPKEQGGGEALVIAWLWARTVKCPNPACGTQMPMINSFILSAKKDQRIWIEPIVDPKTKIVHFGLRQGMLSKEQFELIQKGTKRGRGANFACLICGTTPTDSHIKSEGMQGRLDVILKAVVAEVNGRRVYLLPDMISASNPIEQPDLTGLMAELADDPRNIWCKQYGLRTFADLFTPRQLVTLITLSNLLGTARERVLTDAHQAATVMIEESGSMNPGGIEAQAYADAVATYLALGISKMTDYNSSLVAWSQTRDQARNTFARQALPMVWDFAEVNPFAGAAGDLTVTLAGISETLERSLPATVAARANQLDATSGIEGMVSSLISTDPPYYDNISYAVM